MAITHPHSSVPILGPRLVIVGEPTTVGTHYAGRLSQWFDIALVAPPSHASIDEVIEQVTRPAVARSGFLVQGVPRTVAEAVSLCDAVGAPFDLAIDLTHAIDHPIGQDERYLRAWLEGMGVLVEVDATMPSQAVWAGLLEALHPVLWGTGQLVG